MSQFTASLASRVDTSKAFIPEIHQCITPKQQSAVNRKYSTMQVNPWDKAPVTPALAYGTTPPAITGPPAYNNVPPPGAPYGGAVPPGAPYGGAVPPHGGEVPPSYGGAVPPFGGAVPPTHGGGLPPRPSGLRAPPGPPQVQNTQPQGYVPQVPGNPFAHPPVHNVSPVPTPIPTPTPTNPFGGVRPLPPQAQTKPSAKALWDFNGSNPDELSFKAGDIIIIHEKTGDWWKGESRGTVGLLPGNYVQLC